MRTVIKRTLKLTGLRIGKVSQAANGREALDFLAETTVDLALVDVNMPIMNGLELVERVRSTPAIAALPVIVVSTEASGTRIETLRAHGVAFVRKPFTPETLVDAIVGMLGESDESGVEAASARGCGPDF